MKLDRRQLGIHLPWGLIAAIPTVALVAWYVTDSGLAGQWLGGGSPAGLACRLGAGLVIALDMLLWPSKCLRRLPLMPARHWMAAHIWLGFVSLPLAIFHCGFLLGGWLHTLCMLLFVLAIVSGIYGLLFQNVIPKLALRRLPAETIYSQIEHVSQQNIQDLKQAIIAFCGLKPGDKGWLKLAAADDCHVWHRYHWSRPASATQQRNFCSAGEYP